MITVAGHFHFDDPSLWAMTRSRLMWWYEAVAEDYREAKNAAKNAAGKTASEKG